MPNKELKNYIFNNIIKYILIFDAILCTVCVNDISIKRIGCSTLLYSMYVLTYLVGTDSSGSNVSIFLVTRLKIF